MDLNFDESYKRTNIIRKHSYYQYGHDVLYRTFRRRVSRADDVKIIIVIKINVNKNRRHFVDGVEINLILGSRAPDIYIHVNRT